MNTLPPALDPKSCHSRQEAVRGLLKEQQLDAALFLNRNYVHALTAYWHEQSLTPVALIVPLNGKTILVAPGENLDVPAAKADAQIDTVVPFRNMLFVTLAAACDETLGAHDIYLSPVRDDYAAYRDCSREFYDSLQSCLCLGASKDGEFRIHTPLVNHSKVEVVAMGLNLAVPFAQTHTCYEGWRPACGVCDACSERRSAFAANDSVDPLEYETGGQSAP